MRSRMMLINPLITSNLTLRYVVISPCSQHLANFPISALNSKGFQTKLLNGFDGDAGIWSKIRRNHQKYAIDPFEGGCQCVRIKHVRNRNLSSAISPSRRSL